MNFLSFTGLERFYEDLKTVFMPINATTIETASKLGDKTVGSGTKFIYLKDGTATASGSTVGSLNVPVWLSSGNITAVGSTLNVDITGTAAATQTALTEHTERTDNPHGVTAEQLGLSALLKYGGSVSSYSMLPKSPELGDVYNIVNADLSYEIKAGDNVVWNGTEWDNFSGTFSSTEIYNAVVQATSAITEEEILELFNEDDDDDDEEEALN